MISAVEFKRYIAGASIFSIIIGEFRHKKKLCLVILFKIHKSLKIGSHHTILLFGLTVYLLVDSNRKFPFNIKEIV